MEAKTKKKNPDFMTEAVDAVEHMDLIRLKKITGESLEAAHTKAVAKIKLCNNFLGKGTISISKARTILQTRLSRVKAEAAGV